MTERVIDPYELNYSARGAEVDAGPLDEDGRIRTFLVSRIRDIDVLDETFQRPGDALALCAAAREPTPVIGTSNIAAGGRSTCGRSDST